MDKCEIGGCYRTPVEKAHIYSKGGGGSRKPHNIINLCVEHHRGDGKSMHQMGVWAFAKLHGLTERFQKAYEIEQQIEREKRLKYYAKVRAKQAENRKKYCPTCKRQWNRGVTREQLYGHS